MTGRVNVTPEERTPGFWRRVGEDIRYELPGLLGANALFLAWCTPAALLAMIGWTAPAALVAPVTIGPGLAGLTRYAGRLARGEGARWWQDSLAGARASSVVCAVLVTVGLAAVVLPGLALRLAVAHGLTVATTAILTAQALGALFLVVLCVHVSGLVALYGQPAGLAFRNAVLLTLSHPVSSAGPVGLGLLFVHVAQFFGWGPLVVLPAILALCAVHHTRRLAEDGRAITPETPQETPCPLL